MSLLELVVAIAIGGVAISTAVAGTALIVHSRQVAASATLNTMRAAHARDIIADMLSGAFADENGNVFAAEDREYSDSPDDRLTFVTRHVPGRTAAIAAADLHIDHDPGSTERGLTVSYTAGPSAMHRLPLAVEAESFNLRFFSGGQWLDRWPYVGQLPLAVELRLDGNDLPRVLRVPVVVHLHQGVE